MVKGRVKNVQRRNKVVSGVIKPLAGSTRDVAFSTVDAGVASQIGLGTLVSFERTNATFRGRQKAIKVKPTR